MHYIIYRPDSKTVTAEPMEDREAIPPLSLSKSSHFGPHFLPRIALSTGPLNTLLTDRLDLIG